MSRFSSWWLDWDVTTPRRRPDPPIAIETRAAVPAWVVRALAGAAVLGGGLVFAAGGTQVVAVALLAVGVAVAPHGLVAVLAVAAAVLGYAVRPPDAATGALLLLCVHLVATLTRYAAGLSPRARVEVAVLRRAAPAFLAVQAFAQALAAGAWLLGRPEEPVTWLAVVALAALTVLVWRAVRAVQTTDRMGS